MWKKGLNTCYRSQVTIFTSNAALRPILHITRDKHEVNVPEFQEKREEPGRKGSIKGRVAGYMMLAGASAGLVAGVSNSLSEIVEYLKPDGDALHANIVDISGIEKGQSQIVRWKRGWNNSVPVIIKHRTEEEIREASNVNLNELKDPQADDQRRKKPEWVVLVARCTHLGCVPLLNAGNYEGGFFCPCHGAHFDGSGRAREGPAPTNLEIPPYKFLNESSILLGAKD